MYHARKRVVKNQIASLRKPSRGIKSRRAFSLFIFCTPFLTTLFFRHRVCASTTEYLDLIDCNNTTELYAAERRTYEYVFVYTCHVFLLLLCVPLLDCCYCCVAAAAACCCCWSSCAGWRKKYFLLLSFIASDPSVFFFFIIQKQLT